MEKKNLMMVGDSSTDRQSNYCHDCCYWSLDYNYKMCCSMKFDWLLHNLLDDASNSLVGSYNLECLDCYLSVGCKLLLDLEIPSADCPAGGCR